MEHSCVDYYQTPTPGLGSTVAGMDVILATKEMKISRTAEKETSCMNHLVHSATLLKIKEQERKETR